MRFVFALLAGLFMSTAWAQADPTGAPTVRQLTRNKEVRFEKIRFQVGDRLVRSAWGQVTIDGRRIARRAGVTDGFVSIRIARGWAAVNIPITTNPGQYFPRAFADARIVDDGARAKTVVRFDLGTARPGRRIDAVAVMTTTPLTGRSAADMQVARLEPTRFKLKKAIVDGGDTGLSLGFAPPDPGGLPPPPPNPLPFEAPDFWQVLTPNPVNIEAASAQCAPIAAANTMAYIAQTFGQETDFSLPRPAVKGVDEDTSLPGLFDTYMNRNVTSTCVGSSTGYCQDSPNESGILDGIYTFLRTHTAFEHAEVRFQGNQGDNCESDEDITTFSDGNVVTFEWICDRIAAGDGVIITRHDYQNIDGVRTQRGGHAVRVYGCGEANGTPFLRVVNDTLQDSASSGVCVERDGLALEFVTVPVGVLGRMNYDGNVMQDIEYAIAISLRD